METAKRLVLPLAIVALFALPLVALPLSGCGASVAICGGWWCIGVPIPPPCDPYVCTSFVAGSADLDGNGSEDLVTFADGDVHVRLADGSGGVGAQAQFTLGLASVHAIHAGDFDGDGATDVAFLDYSAGQVRVLLGNGAGSLPTAGPIVPLAGPVIDSGVGRVDGTTSDDLLVLDGGGGLTAWLGDGAGGFTIAAAGRQALDCGGTALAVGLLNGDTTADAVVVNRNTNAVCAYVGSATGAYTRSSEAFTTVGSPRQVILGEFDGRTGTDIATHTSAGAEVFFGNNAGGLVRSSQGPVGLGSGALRLFAVPSSKTPAGPDHLGVLAASGSAAELRGVRNVGLGTFGEPEEPVHLPGMVFGLVTTDVDGDTRPDLVAFLSDGIYVAQGGPGQD